ncbi:MAG: DUF2797 domain-containing protein [Bacteroidia bacterium]|nr:DUF2797 domain-containing protein [Bacteroidia bacterium]
MTFTGNLRKMAAEAGSPIRYTLQLGDDAVSLNGLLGQEIRLRFEGVINCKICGRVTKKAFGEGFCYPHFMNHPENSPCIVRPELCEGHLGKGRDAEWELTHHVQPHTVYLALTSGVKVGVTRSTQIPTRWIDQGAWKTIRLAETPQRQLAGAIEVALKAYVTDKTPWQDMLRDRREDADLTAEKARLHALLPPELQAYYSENPEIQEFAYPVLQYPESVKSISLDKTPDTGGMLAGIRGQYLIFGDGRAINVRSHTGYKVTLETA